MADFHQLTRSILLDTTKRVVVQGDKDVEQNDATNNVPAGRLTTRAESVGALYA